MAEAKIRGRDTIVSIDADDNGSFKPVACLTSNTYSSSLTEINASSKCGNEYIPGDQFDDTISGEGFSITESGTPAKESFIQLKDLYDAKTIFPARFGPASPNTGEYYLQGDVFISALDQVAEDNNVVTFSVTFRVTVPPLQQYPAY